MKIVIDTEKNIVMVDGDVVFNAESTGHKTDLAGMFEAYEGTKEYEGIVKVIQTWYYGDMVKAAWCATAVSYFAYICGLSDLVGKYENVDYMKENLRSKGRLDCTANYGGGAYKPKRNDLVFFSKYNTYTDCTHVMVVQEIKGDYVICIGGNTDDAITSKTYNYKTNKYVVAFGNLQR